MNILYVKRLRYYFEGVPSERLQNTVRTAEWSESTGLVACFGTHCAFFFNRKLYGEKSKEEIYDFRDGIEANEENGLTLGILREAYSNAGGTLRAFDPYSGGDWEVPVVNVLDEVLREHGQE